MAATRQAFQGLTNIVRFNWHFYVLAFTSCLALLVAGSYGTGLLALASYCMVAGIAGTVLISLCVSWYVYDHCSLYDLSWLQPTSISPGSNILNVHAGFDETSSILAAKFPQCKLTVLDFYDPVVHTEVSIRRARKAYPAYAGTIRCSTAQLPLPDHSMDAIIVIFAAHEIRNEAERILFFKELKRVLHPAGQIFVTEHLRDAANFAAFNIGFLHFYGATSWQGVFAAAGLTVQRQQSITAFVNTYQLSQ